MKDVKVLSSLLFLKSSRCGVKMLVTYGVLNMFMVVGNLNLGWACTRRKCHSFGSRVGLVLINNPDSLGMFSWVLISLFIS